MNTPLATYRVQFNREFGFSDLKAVVPYLAKLGISHIYASPIFQARKGSTHGYDIIDHAAINEELGGAAGFEELIKETRAYRLGWLQDIVPNHAAYSLENKKIFDVLQNGPQSRYSGFFDIDWNHPSRRLNGRTLVPFLDKELAQSIEQKEIALSFNGGFKIRCGSLQFPLNAKSTQELQRKENAEQTVKRVNDSPKFLSRLLSEQFYALTYWRDVFREINYRRFFDILDLIGVRVEEPSVFEETHKLALDLLSSGKISGLRVDHIDGLFDPKHYLQTLRQQAPDAYILVEKILADEEELDESWPIQGSTGYDFINYVNGLFVKRDKEAATNSIYELFTGNTQGFGETLFDCKKTVIVTYFQGDIANLARQINQTLQSHSHSQFDPAKMPDAIAALIACFPIYRTYLSPKNSTDQKGYFYSALKQAKQHKPEYSKELDSINFLLEQCGTSLAALQALMRLQQFTGAVMAKGLEDTAFYRYCRFLSLNEVGGDPAKFGTSTDQFHSYNLSRQTRWPLALNASSTHDTKRGEDARARLNVLSEVPQELQEHLLRWAEINSKHKTQIHGEPAPDRNEEYLIYQTLLGSYPFEAETQEFTQRANTYIMKALREAKTHTSWLNPNSEYENTTTQFLNQMLSNPDFLDDFIPFQKQVAHYGSFNTLSQTLLKITCPGVPSFYQGSELWNLSMVDPDNRRPVDYKKSEQFLAEISELKTSNVKGLLEDYKSGKGKLYLIFRTLQVRRRLRALFEQGAYVPLAVEGELAEHVFAFARCRLDCFVVVVVSRFLVGLLESSNAWRVDWKDTSLVLPANAPTAWNEAFTDLEIHSASGRLSVGEALEGFPVALLVGDIKT